MVASEVRSLAQRSAVAAKDIEGLISDSISKVTQGAQLVEQSGMRLEAIVKSIEAVDGVVQDIANASVKQSELVDAVRRAVQDMDVTTQQNAAMVEQVAASSEFMKEKAEGLEQSIRFFKIDEEVAEQATLH